jgi:hypothetical protein
MARGHGACLWQVAKKSGRELPRSQTRRQAAMGTGELGERERRAMVRSTPQRLAN